MNPSGTNAEDKLNIAQELFKGRGKKGTKKGKAFTLHHCWTEIENEEKWKSREYNEVPHKKKSSVGDATQGEEEHDDASSGEDGKRSPTPNSVAPKKRPDGRKKGKEKLKKGGDKDVKESLDAIMIVRKEMAEERKMLKVKEMEERREADERRAAADERRAAAEERRAAAEEKKVAAEEKKAEIEERKVAMEERMKGIENEQKLMFMDTSGLDDKARAYLELCRDQVLAMRSMGGFIGAMGGGMGAMGGFMGGMGRGMGAMGGNGANGGNDGMGGNGVNNGNGENATSDGNVSNDI